MQLCCLPLLNATHHDLVREYPSPIICRPPHPLARAHVFSIEIIATALNDDRMIVRVRKQAVVHWIDVVMLLNDHPIFG